jgi:hypothetical protein
LYDVSKQRWNDGQSPRETRKLKSFRKKENEVLENYIDVRIGNYVVLSPEQVNPLKQEEEDYF